MEFAGIALGSNIEDRVAHLEQARRLLHDLHEGTPATFRSSPIYETSPVDCAPGTASFLNAIVELQTSLAPLPLLDQAQAIEGELGRPRDRERNAPRTIDVDLIYLGDYRADSERLILPHPRWSERRFVLLPLRDLRPDLRLAGSPQSIKATLDVRRAKVFPVAKRMAAE